MIPRTQERVEVADGIERRQTASTLSGLVESSAFTAGRILCGDWRPPGPRPRHQETSTSSGPAICRPRSDGPERSCENRFKVECLRGSLSPTPGDFHGPERAERDRRRLLGRTTRLWMTIGLAAALCSCEPSRSTGRVREAALPKGAVETPGAGTVVTDEVVISGWASSPDGLDDVAVYANGAYVDSAVLGFFRPDVLAADPSNAPEGTSGFRLRLEGFRLPPGNVTLVVQARTRAGSTRDLGVVPISVSRPG
jgi:hypothetical protein